MSDQDTLLAVIDELRAEVRSLAARVGELETQLQALAPHVTPPVAPAPVTADASITEEELLAISAAIAAFLGVRAKIRQVRLVHSATWAQVGRVHIQASHRVH
ncbi:MAG: hypothetical protein JSR42_12040 [Proteobacteria bacterium]|nr:hypothetical protein [Pseudomonadota bacterium]